MEGEKGNTVTKFHLLPFEEKATRGSHLLPLSTFTHTATRRNTPTIQQTVAITKNAHCKYFILTARRGENF